MDETAKDASFLAISGVAVVCTTVFRKGGGSGVGANNLLMMERLGPILSSSLRSFGTRAFASKLHYLHPARKSSCQRFWPASALKVANGCMWLERAGKSRFFWWLGPAETAVGASPIRAFLNVFVTNWKICCKGPVLERALSTPGLRRRQVRRDCVLPLHEKTPRMSDSVRVAD